VVDGPVEMLDIAPTLLNLLDIPVPVRMRGTDLGPWLACRRRRRHGLPPAFAEVEDKRMVVAGTDKLLCDLHWGSCAYYDLAADPARAAQPGRGAPERAAALRAILRRLAGRHVRFEPLLAKGASNPRAGRCRRAIERGRLGDALAGPELAALMTSARPLSAARGGAAAGGAAGRPETARR
jgi:hypothetical protein